MTTNLTEPAPIGLNTPSPSTAVDGRAWRVLAILCFVYVLNFLCRQLPSILAKPIQDSLGMTDGQIGLIGGLYFALFYCCISIPVGWLADRTNRVMVLMAACAIWSVATMGCGLAAAFPQFVFAYMVVGFGEAGGVPPSYAIISDYFPPGRRGTAFGLFNLGPPLGLALGIGFGALIAAAWSWRHAFVILGSIGIVAVILVYAFVPEPQRGGLDAESQKTAVKASFWQTLVAFFSRPTLLLVALAAGATQFVVYGMNNFTALFLMREKGMTLQEVALYYALVAGVGTSVSMLVTGRLLDRFTRRWPQAYALIPAISLTTAIPFFVAFVWQPSWPLALVLLIGPVVLNVTYLSASVALVQESVRPDQRVMSGALLLLVMNLIGLGLGPTYVGGASDYFRAHGFAHPLQTALYTLTPFYVVAILLFLRLAKKLRTEHAAKRQTP